MGAGSIWQYLQALVKGTRESGRFSCGLQTDLHFAVDAASCRFDFTGKRGISFTGSKLVAVDLASLVGVNVALLGASW